MPSVRKRPIICSTSTCLCMVVASTIAPATFLLLARRMNDSTTGACDKSAALARNESKYGRQREDRGEERHGNADGLLHDPRVVVDVRVELAADEIFVLDRDLFERHR